VRAIYVKHYMLIELRLSYINSDNIALHCMWVDTANEAKLGERSKWAVLSPPILSSQMESNNNKWEYQSIIIMIIEKKKYNTHTSHFCRQDSTCIRRSKTGESMRAIRREFTDIYMIHSMSGEWEERKSIN